MAKKRVSRPRKLKIGNNEYEVKTRKYKSWAKKKSKTRTFGQIRYNKNKLIEVCEDQKQGLWNSQQIEALDTVIHEVLHGIIHEYQIGVDGRKEEKWVTLIANGLTDVLLKNPKLMEWLKVRIEQQTTA